MIYIELNFEAKSFSIGKQDISKINEAYLILSQL